MKNYAILLIIFTALTPMASTSIGANAANIQKCTVKAGKTAGTDSLSFSGLLNATAQHLEGSTDIVVTIDSDRMAAPLTATFPINVNTYKKGKYTSPIVRTGKTDPAMSLKYDTRNGKLSFAGRNLNLKGLSCPMNIHVYIGAYAAQATLNENIINGKQPMPIQFMMGVADTLRTDRVSVRFGKKEDSDSLSVRGAFTVEDLAAFENGLAQGNPIVVILGDDNFTLPASKLARFDPVRCTFTINLKGLTIRGYGEVDFAVNLFGIGLESMEKIDLGPKRAYNLEELRLYNVPGQYLYNSTYSEKGPGGSSKGDEQVTVYTDTFYDQQWGRWGYGNYSAPDSDDWWEELDWWTGPDNEVMAYQWYGRNDLCEFGIFAAGGQLQVAPSMLRLGQSFTNIGTFSGYLDDIAVDDATVNVSNLYGTVKSTCRLVRHEEVTVPEGTFTAARVEQTYAFNGKMDVHIDYGPGDYDDTSGKMTLNIKLVWWGVPNVGIVKMKDTTSIKLTAAGVGSLSAQVTSQDTLAAYQTTSGIPLPRSKTLSGTVSLPQDSPLNLAQLTLRSIAGQAALTGSGAFSGFEAIDTTRPQIVFLEDVSGTTIAAAYLSPDQLSSGSIQIGPEEMALGLIKMNPYVMVLPSAQQQEIMAAAANHPDFDGLVNEIRTALVNAPTLALDYESYPYIYQKAVRIGIETIADFSEGLNLLQAAYANMGLPGAVNKANVIGDDGDPHLADKPGDAITFVNPKMTFYGIQANSLHNVMRGKAELFTFWPPWEWGPTQPHTKDWNLGDGAFHITFYKGFNLGTEGWCDYTHAAGKATYGNFAKIIFIALDIAGLDWLSLQDSTIESLLLLENHSVLSDLDEIAHDLAQEGWKYVMFEKLPKWMEKPENWQKVKYLLWQETAGWPDHSDTVSRFLIKAGPVWDGIQTALGVVGLVLDTEELANEWIPFLYDLAFGPWIVEYDVQQVNGVLTELASYIPPTAVFSADDYSPVIGQTVTFDASASFDDRDAPAALRVRWDFDGDQTWDTPWQFEKAATYAYGQRRTYRPKLQVEDSQGLTSIISRDIIVGSLDAFKIVLTWGANPRDLDSHLYTPQIGGSTYHVYYSNKGSAADAPYVWLDLDDTSGYGPETIWFEAFYPGTYRFSVYLFSGTGSLSTSGAHVEVIDSNGVVASFNVPDTGSERWWHVFELDGSTRHITPINTISSSAPAGVNSTMIGYGLNSTMSVDTMPPKE